MSSHAIIELLTGTKALLNLNNMSFFKRRPLLPDHLNICLIANKFPVWGRASDHGFLWPVARGLVKKGHQVTVLSWRNTSGDTEVLRDGVKVYFLGELYGRSTLSFAELADRKFSELHAQTPFHLVHSIDASGSIIAQKKKTYGIAIAYDVEATHMSQIFAVLGLSQETIGGLLRTAAAVTYRYLTTFLNKDRRILKFADAVFVASPLQQVTLERYYLFPQLKTHLVPFGIEIGDLSPREQSDELKDKLKIPRDAQIVVSYSDMNEVGEMKNVLHAFEAVAIKKPLARLLIIGTGPKQKEIEFVMLNLALGNRVIFAGPITGQQLPDYIALADVFVNISSRTSGFEPCNLEAMAQKKIVIGSENSPMASVVENGRDGFLIRPADIHHLADLLLRVFNGELTSQSIGEAARTKVLNVFDTQRMVLLTLDAYYGALLHSGLYGRPASKSAASPTSVETHH